MEIKRTFDILEKIRNNNQRVDMLNSKRNGKWESISTEAYYEMAHLVSYGLRAMGFNKEDKIASVSNNRYEWNIMDMGMSQIGVIHVPIYPTLGAEEYEYILQHSEAKAVFVADEIMLKRISKGLEKSKNIKEVFLLSEHKDHKSIYDIIELGKQHKEEFETEVEKTKKEIDPDDIATIIYTSGTTGVSKGVMLTHKNLATNVMDTKHLVHLDPSDKVLSFLPLCHIFERMANYLFQYCGLGLYYAENMGTIANNLREIKPGGFTTVPRLLESVYDKIIAKGKALKGIKKVIFFWAVNLGLRYEFNRANGAFYEFKLKLANKLVFNKWREALGGRIQLIVSGGAALQPRLARVFWAAQVPVQEGYGLTETSPVIAVNDKAWPNIMFGTVGPTLKHIDLKITEDGEICVKGPSIMKGYYKAPDLTKEVIDEEGWFHTGDVGEIIDNKFLKITDRKKEIFKNSAGKYIAPQMIENKFKESFFIEQIMVIGENEKIAAALISPNFSFMHDYCARKGIHYRDNTEMIHNPRVIERIQKEVNTYNHGLSPHEQVKKFRLVAENWTPETGELSPTLKLKRRYLYTKYHKLMKEIYQ